jgi:aspartyl protease family protein
MVKEVLKYLLMTIFFASSLVAATALQDVRIEGLFNNAAVININGQQHLLKKGQEILGVSLISANSKTARLRINGEEHTMPISRAMNSGGYQKKEEVKATLVINSAGQYFASGSINDRPVRVLVDTGATAVAMNTQQARILGVDFTRGQVGRVSTAGGIVKSYSVTLNSISVGGIEAEQVRAVVLEGIYPTHILLGMSYLNHVKIQEDAGVMTLIKKY